MMFPRVLFTIAIKNKTVKLELYIPAFLIILLVSATAFAELQSATKQDIINAILERQEFTAEEKSAMDLNGDQIVNVSDLIYLLKHQTSDSLEGVYTGFFVRNNPNLKDGQSEVFGQVPLSFIVFYDGGFKGMVNKSETVTDEGEKSFQQEYYSLYFPDNDSLVVSQVSGTTGTNLHFKIEFKSQSETLSDNELLRTMEFTGTFDDKNKALVSGTYTETINGIVDNLGNDLGIKLSGKFMLMKEQSSY